MRKFQHKLENPNNKYTVDRLENCVRNNPGISITQLAVRMGAASPNSMTSALARCINIYEEDDRLFFFRWR